VIVGGETELTQGHGTKQTSSSTNRLVKDETIDAARAARLAAEYGKLFEAEAACLALLNRINDEPGEAEKLAARAKDVLAAAAKDVRDPEVAAEFQRLIKRHGENGGYDVEDAQRRLARIGKPLDDWEATDLDGKKWSRDGLKGNVVVMDFWYRGCGWCIFAMPELKKLAADYKGRDVVVLGMNTDRKEEDARFVVEAMGLNYPQVKAGDFAKRVGVTSFPTFIVVDRSGVVRGIHSGFRPDFGKSLARRINELLEEKPESTGRPGSRTNP
jgi:thiol-disulfide isomerase/thioredoxin